MIHRDKGELLAECNDCGNEHYGGTLDFHDFLAELKRIGWQIRKEEDEWVHRCPECV